MAEQTENQDMLRAAGKEVRNRSIRAQVERMVSVYRSNNSKDPRPEPVRKYLVISTPRVGSTLVCDKLESTRVFGWPKEWFNELYVKTAQDVLGRQLSFRDYVEMLVQGTRMDSNVVGIHMHVLQYQKWKSLDIDLLQIGFDKIYWIERNDKIAQAHSLAKAQATQMWSKSGEKEARVQGSADVRIRPSQVARQLNRICTEVEYFDDHLSAHVDRKYIYEELVQDQCRHLVEDLCADFGFDLPGMFMSERESKKQSKTVDQHRIEEIRRVFGYGKGGNAALSPQITVRNPIGLKRHPRVRLPLPPPFTRQPGR